VLRCRKCESPIDTTITYITARSSSDKQLHKYHANCFVCTFCNKKIPLGAKYLVKGDKIVCEEDVVMLRPKCGVCGKPCISQYIHSKDSGGYYHKNCCKCSLCQIVIAGDLFLNKAGKMFCKDCVQLKLALRASNRGKINSTNLPSSPLAGPSVRHSPPPEKPTYPSVSPQKNSKIPFRRRGQSVTNSPQSTADKYLVRSPSDPLFDKRRLPPPSPKPRNRSQSLKRTLSGLIQKVVSPDSKVEPSPPTAPIPRTRASSLRSRTPSPHRRSPEKLFTNITPNVTKTALQKRNAHTSIRDSSNILHTRLGDLTKVVSATANKKIFPLSLGCDQCLFNCRQDPELVYHPPFPQPYAGLRFVYDKAEVKRLEDGLNWKKPVSSVKFSYYVGELKSGVPNPLTRKIREDRRQKPVLVFVEYFLPFGSSSPHSEKYIPTEEPDPITFTVKKTFIIKEEDVEKEEQKESEIFEPKEGYLLMLKSEEGQGSKKKRKLAVILKGMKKDLF